MKFLKQGLLFMPAFLLYSYGTAYAQFGLGADVMSRYVWRGTDYGNSAAVQPYISYTAGAVEVGAWASWSIDGSPNGNENDLYVTYSTGPVGITITDYFFPGFTGDDQFFEFGNDIGAHSLEASVSYGGEGFSLLAGYFFTGSEGVKEAVYLEGSYDLPLPTDEVSASLFLGAGNETLYTTDGDFNIVSIGLALSKESWSAT